MIRWAAKLNRITKDYKPVNKEFRWNYDVDLCRDLAWKTAEQIGTPDAKEKRYWLEQELSKLILPDSLPKGICHCDFHFSNVLFSDDELRALIDFDDANYTYLTFDLVSLINPFISAFRWDSWSGFEIAREAFDFGKPRRIASLYQTFRSLSPLEKRHLFDVFKLSILLDCIWYFKRGSAENFFEKKKINLLNEFGREKFRAAIFE